MQVERLEHSNGNVIPIEDLIRTFIPNKAAMYRLCMTKGYYMCKPKCSILTIRFMDLIVRGEVFWPRQNATS